MTEPTSPARRVLLVDDRRDVTFLLKTLLSRRGYEVFTAESGTQGLDAVRQFAPHTVISDLNLGGEIDGITLVSTVRADPELSVPCFIAITGFDDDEHRRLAREAGFDHYLVKPVALDELSALLARIDAESLDQA